MNKKIYLKTLLVAVGLCAGSMSAWAGDVTTLYERGDGTEWAESDLTNWTNTNCTPDISSGLHVALYNTGWSTKTTILPTTNAIVTVNATINGAKANGRNGSYDYIKVGGVSFRIYGQDQKATIDIDGTETSLATKITRGSDYSIKFIVNTATGAVTYAYNGGSDTEAATTSSTSISEIVFGHSRYSSENTGWGTFDATLKKIKVTNETQDVSTASYTINYIYNEETIKTTEGTNTIGATVNAENPVTVSGTRYFAKDGETTSMEITNGTNVLNVDLRTAETFGYTVNAVDGSDNILATLSSGSCTEGDDISLAYPRYVLSGTTLYASGAGGVTYSTTFMPDADNYVKKLTYNSGTVTDVAYYTEGEDVSGVSVGANAARASVGRMGYTTDENTYKDVTPVAPGKYKIYARGQNGNASARTFNFKVGEVVVFTGSIANGTNLDSNSDEFSVMENSTLSFACVGSSQSGMDYFYLVRTGDVTVSKEISAVGWATYYSPYALDLENATNLTDAYIVTGGAGGVLTKTSVKGGTVPANTGLLLKGTEGSAVEVTIPVVASSSTDVSGNKLLGVTSETDLDLDDNDDGTADQSVYVLMNETNGLGFYQTTTTSFTLGANTAYLPANFAGATARYFNLEDPATGINSVKGKEFMVNGSEIYNLQGQRVAQPAKGLYIINGKKVMVK